MRDTIAGWALGAYLFILPVVSVLFGVCLLILAPLTLFRPTRPWAGIALLIGSWVFGVATWLLGAGLSFSYFGWLGLILGLVFFGIGVVPLGIWAGFFGASVYGPSSPGLGWIMLELLATTLVARFLGTWAVTRASEAV
jgi:hypothetical protein